MVFKSFAELPAAEACIQAMSCNIAMLLAYTTSKMLCFGGPANSLLSLHAVGDWSWMTNRGSVQPCAPARLPDIADLKFQTSHRFMRSYNDNVNNMRFASFACFAEATAHLTAFCICFVVCSR